jgi:hypothetical protein
MREWDRLNYEAVEPPLYYVVAGAWYRLGTALGLSGGRLFYWTRFLNALLEAATVAVAVVAARLAMTEAPALAVGVALFVALVPRWRSWTRPQLSHRTRVSGPFVRDSSGRRGNTPVRN